MLIKNSFHDKLTAFLSRNDLRQMLDELEAYYRRHSREMYSLLDNVNRTLVSEIASLRIPSTNYHLFGNREEGLNKVFAIEKLWAGTLYMKRHPATNAHLLKKQPGLECGAPPLFRRHRR